MIKIGTNILSQTVQRNLGRATQDLSTTSERLASGQRINKASDDAGGLSVSAGLNVDRRVFHQGVRNLADGISQLNIAESSVSQLTDIVTRISELAAQGANGSYSSTQRMALQKEASALESEYNRILNGTTFNGNQLLTGDSTHTAFQAGYGSTGVLSVQIGKAAISADNQAGETRVASSSSTGLQGNAGSGENDTITISADGRFIAFSSSASNLVSGDTNGVTDIFVKDTTSGVIARVSSSSAGTEGNAASIRPTISADGRYVVFTSSASNLVVGDTNGASDIFMKDLATGTTTLVSSTSTGTVGNSSSLSPSISADGRYVAFESNSSNLVTGDTNGTADIFVKDTYTGLVVRATQSSSGTGANGLSRVASISADGSTVAFHSDATNLVSGDSNGVTDIFVKNILTGSIIRASTDSSGLQGNAASNNFTASALSADGRFVSFYSSASNLVAGDSNGVNDVFVKDLQSGTTVRVSTDSSGSQGNGISSVASISADGRYVIFGSIASNLVSGDNNGTYDVFIKDTQTGVTRRANINSEGLEANGYTGNFALSGDGLTVAYASDATNLIAGDTNAVRDIFVTDLSKAGIQELAGVVVSNQGSARITLDAAQRRLENLSYFGAGIRASIGRAEVYSKALQSRSDQVSAASARITDVDVAEETSKLLANQIRQQAATSILAQANQSSNLVLQLLN